MGEENKSRKKIIVHNLTSQTGLKVRTVLNENHKLFLHKMHTFVIKVWATLWGYSWSLRTTPARLSPRTYTWHMYSAIIMMTTVKRNLEYACRFKWQWVYTYNKDNPSLTSFFDWLSSSNLSALHNSFTKKSHELFYTWSLKESKWLKIIGTFQPNGIVWTFI